MADEREVHGRMEKAWKMANKLTPFATAAAILAVKVYDELGEAKQTLPPKPFSLTPMF